MASLSTTRSTWSTRELREWASILTAVAKVERAAVHSGRGISPRMAEVMEATASAEGSTCTKSGSAKKERNTFRNEASRT